MHALMQARGDAVIGMASDLQDPPEMIPDMVAKWEEGYSVVLCIKRASEENPLMFWLRKKYYALVQRLSSIETFENFTGFGLYDRRVVEAVRTFDDPYPYFRGMIAEIGLPYCQLSYDQPRRKRGITKNNFYSLYDLGMLSFNGQLGCFATAYLAFAVAILVDKNGIFPKWLAYLTIWQIVTEVIATQMWQQTSGPFAWNGSIAFWLAVIVFGVWLNCQGLMLKKATDEHPAGTRPPE